MKKIDLITSVQILKEETRKALQTMYDTLNHGQRQKVVKEEDVKALFDRYGVNYNE